ncbi:MAG: helix-turn-helix domain-containing protein [Pseudomonadota bacterium]
MNRSTLPPRPQLEYVDASSDMRDLVHTLFVIRAGEGQTEDIMPAYSAQLFSFVEGAGLIAFPDREVGRSVGITLNAPMLRAAPMLLDGPVLNVGASFTPLGWAAFSGLAADKVHDTAFPANTLLPQESLAPVEAALARCRAGELSPESYCRVIEDMIRQVCRAPNRAPRADHADLVTAIDAWLESAFNPSVGVLYESVDLGQRQVQRLCRRYYGVPPAQLVKRYRAIRAAMLLAHEELSAELRDEVLGAYFDQAHLIHDVRRYTGRTPKSLVKGPLAQDMLDPEGHGQSAKKLRDE